MYNKGSNLLVEYSIFGAMSVRHNFGHFASTWTMNVLYMCMEHLLPEHISGRFFILDPRWVEQYNQSNKVTNILGCI